PTINSNMCDLIHITPNSNFSSRFHNVISQHSKTFFFFQAEDGIRDGHVTGVQTCALPIFIVGPGDEVLHVLGGAIESNREGQRLLDARWRVEVGQPADTVIASISAAKATFEDLAHAFHAAARVVKAGGRIILMTDADPPLGRAP